MGSLTVLRDREFLALSGTAFARAQAYSTVAIALALYADLFNTSSTVEGLFGTAFALVQLLVVLPIGRYVDTHDAKRVLLGGLLVNVVVFGGYFLADSVADVILVRVLQGFGASVLWVTGSTVVGEISPDGGRGQWLGTYNQVGAFSSLAGDMVGGALLTLYGFQETYVVLGAVTLGASVLLYSSLRANPGGRTDPAESTGRETLRNLLGRGTVRALVTFRFGLSFGKMAVITFVPIYARTGFGMSAILVGVLLAGGKLTKALTQGVVGGYTDRVGSKHYFVAGGALVYVLGTSMIPFAEFAGLLFPTVAVPLAGLPGLSGSVTLVPAFFLLFLAYGICGVGDSLRLPASMALFVEEGEQFEAVAGSLSLRSIGWKVGQVVGPLLIGVVWDATGVFTAFAIAAGAILAATLAFVRLYGTAWTGTSPVSAD
ncbi:MFS transporter [Halobacteriales archaeon QS_5_70_15]|nr:MAG: MFS transporter [Halobacteriales archaeon QS_5_70_15]